MRFAASTPHGYLLTWYCLKTQTHARAWLPREVAERMRRR